jgi:hypothetical protein
MRRALEAMIVPAIQDDVTAFSLHLALSVLVALVFVRAAALKFRSRTSFEGVVDNYDLLPQALVTPVAAALPITEGVMALALLVPAADPWAKLAAAVLLGVFALAMGINLVRGRSHIDCGCGDARSRQPLHVGLVIRNLALAGLLTVAALTSPGAPSLVGVALGVAAGGAAFLLYICQDTFAALPRRPRSDPLPAPDPRLGFAIHHRSGAAR